jgi:thermitase
MEGLLQNKEKQMRRSIVLLTMVAAVVLAFSAASPAQPASSQSASAEDFVPGEILVKFEPGARGQDIADIHRQNGGRVKETIRGIDVQVVGVARGQEKSSVARYQHNPNVRYAELNGVYEGAGSVPNDPRVGEQYAFNNTGQTVGTTLGTADADIDAYEAWNDGSTTDWKAGTTGSAAVPIAILDSGIKEDHEDLSGKVTKRINFTSSSTNDDVFGHGTHVAGTVAALTDNRMGVAGTCPGCVLYNVKVLGDDNKGVYSDFADGIEWAADNGAKVINMSFGGSTSSSTLQDAVNYAWGKGVVLVAAAGNSGLSEAAYPAAYEKVIAVGATDSKDQRAVDPTWGSSNYGSWVDVAAPGSKILSTTVDGGYGAWGGTSMASPHVAGVAGLVWSKSGLCATNTCVRSRIESSTANRTVLSGSGPDWSKARINACRAVYTVCAPVVKPPVLQSLVAMTVNGKPMPGVKLAKLAWSATASDGIARFELHQSTNGGVYANVPLSSPTATSISLGLRTGTSYRFKVRAQDREGNWSYWAYGSSFFVS